MHSISDSGVRAPKATVAAADAASTAAIPPISSAPSTAATSPSAGPSPAPPSAPAPPLALASPVIAPSSPPTTPQSAAVPALKVVPPPIPPPPKHLPTPGTSGKVAPALSRSASLAKSAPPLPPKVANYVPKHPEAAVFTFPPCSVLPNEPKASSPISSAAIEQAWTQASQLWPDLDKSAVRVALNTRFAEGEPSRAITLLQFWRDAVKGHITRLSKSGAYTPLRGTSNFRGISCYMDSLLVAMFSRLDNFEPLLYLQSFEDPNTETLAVWLRFFVNLLRNGELITEDIVEGLLAACVNAGWARESTSSPLQQQDTAELFAFITERLRMPLLALKVDIAHAGKEDAEDDHKLVQEQLLYLPVPGSVSDPPILLEECLELYFANSISVSRHIHQQQSFPRRISAPFVSPTSSPAIASASPATPPTSSFARPPTPGTPQSSRYYGEPGTPSASTPSTSAYQVVRRRSYSIISLTTPSIVSTRRFASHDEGETVSLRTTPAEHHYSEEEEIEIEEESVESSPDDLESIHTAHDELLTTPMMAPDSPRSPRTATPPAPQEVVGSLPSYTQLFGGRTSNAATEAQEEARARDMKKNLWTSKNEIMLPAWMFLQLMPFYAVPKPAKDGTLQHLEAAQVAKHFGSTRPVLGLCLKRYSWNEQGRPQRNGRQVIVPETITLPSFVADDSENDRAFGNFKLVLESAVFHRGNNIHSGHYCALVSEQPRTSDARENKKYTAQPNDKRFSWLGRRKNDIADPEPLPLNPTPRGSSTAHKTWLFCDDMAPVGEKVRQVDFNEVFRTEMPYLLFYRMVALDDDEAGRPMTASSVPSTAPVSRQVSPGGLYDESANSSMFIVDPEETTPGKSLAVPPPLHDHQHQPQPQHQHHHHEHHHHRDKKKKRSKFLRLGGQKDYASSYREEKCSIQ